jgi:hypothetical protein
MYYRSSPKRFRYSSSRTYYPHLDDEFKFIYYKDWKVGMNVQCKKAGNIVDLGTIVNKELYGNPRDPDTVLTFSQSGVNTVHQVDFGATYRQYLLVGG